MVEGPRTGTVCGVFPKCKQVVWTDDEIVVVRFPHFDETAEEGDTVLLTPHRAGQRAPYTVYTSKVTARHPRVYTEEDVEDIFRGLVRCDRNWNPIPKEHENPNSLYRIVYVCEHEPTIEQVFFLANDMRDPGCKFGKIESRSKEEDFDETLYIYKVRLYYAKK